MASKYMSLTVGITIDNDFESERNQIKTNKILWEKSLE